MPLSFAKGLVVLFVIHLLPEWEWHTQHRGLAVGQPTAVESPFDEAIPEEIVVATRELPPFAMRDADGQWTGISIELMREIIANLEAASGHEVKLRIERMDLEQMLVAVEEGSVDMAAAAITVNHDREKRMDFTHTFYNAGLGIAVGAKQRRSSWQGVLGAVFSRTFLRIMAGLLVAMLVCAVAIYYFERRHEEAHFSKDWLRGVGAGLWWAAVTLTTVGYGDKVPKSLGGRLVGILWMFAGLFIIASFTAAVTSALTVNQLRSRINGPADLGRVTVATVKGTTSSDYLRSRNLRFQSYGDIRSALQAIETGRCDAVVYDAPILRYLVFRELNSDIYVLPATFVRQNYAFALPTGSPLREPINQILLRHTSSSKWEDTIAKYLGNDPALSQ